MKIIYLRVADEFHERVSKLAAAKRTKIAKLCTSVLREAFKEHPDDNSMETASSKMEEVQAL